MFDKAIVKSPQPGAQRMHTDQPKEMSGQNKQRQKAELRKEKEPEGKPDLSTGKGSMFDGSEGSLIGRNARFSGILIGRKAKLENSPAGGKAVHERLSTVSKSKLEGSLKSNKADHKGSPTGRKGSPKGKKADHKGSPIGKKADHKGSPTGREAEFCSGPKHLAAGKVSPLGDHADYANSDSTSDSRVNTNSKPRGNNSLKAKRYGTSGSPQAQHNSRTTPRQSKNAGSTQALTLQRASSNTIRSSISRTSSSCSFTTSSSKNPYRRKRRRSYSDTSSSDFRLRKRRWTYSPNRFRHPAYTHRHTRRRYSSITSSSLTSASSMTTSCSGASNYSYSSSGSLAAAYGIEASDEEDVDPKYGALNWYVKRTQGDLPVFCSKSMQLSYSWGDGSSVSDTVSTTALICSTEVMSWHWSQSGAVTFPCFCWY